MKRRKRHRIPFWKTALALRALLCAGLIGCVFGFAHNSAIAVYRQANLPPGAEHPWDFYANGFLCVGLLSLAGIYLTRTEEAPARRLSGRVPTAKAWRALRPELVLRFPIPKMAKRTRARSGYNKAK
ncbi:hypothetical protein CCAX7_27300 [Capsulimonas corticalis]|uniref:Uncharacterized protein n=1 Tax=Capsulimonas corticalis TaxID=2219043 RepID=A0A402CTN8_9BACT|nr:hypothetical protein [Capsulimonas corticalis]BDI30679.1 hypothetical protein CCAX7_27300 [Capsulimonas corticalis]